MFAYIEVPPSGLEPLFGLESALSWVINNQVP